MRLIAIFHCWSDWDLLDCSVNSMLPLVDDIIVVGSTKSNYGEFSEIPDRWLKSEYIYIHEPIFSHPSHSETEKRNYGLNIAIAKGATHFITCDADEMYDPKEFICEKQRFDNANLYGLVCRTKVYVKSPSLTIGYDTTLVPFIHKITPGLKHEFNKNYPFAWEGKNLRIDPTRSLNINSGVEWSDITMHHYSWVRKDIEKKIRNSTARANLMRMNLVNKFLHLKEGDIFDLYPNKPLVREQAHFNVPDYGVVQDLQPSTGSSVNSKPV